MKTQRNIFIAFLLNFTFSILEFLGGIWTGSTAIVSDSLHDLGDALSIGLAYGFERKSRKPADGQYTLGYGRYAVLGSVITTLILLTGSALVMTGAVQKIIHPGQIHYDGMIALAVIGVVVNFCGALFTRHGHSLNQKAVNLHMLEDVLGWVVVLMGAIVMRLTGFALIDPLMSMGVALFILVEALRHLKEAMEIFLEKAPRGIDIAAITEQLMTIDGVSGVPKLWVWSMDGQEHHAVVQVVGSGDLRSAIVKILQDRGIAHVTAEVQAPK